MCLILFIAAAMVPNRKIMNYKCLKASRFIYFSYEPLKFSFLRFENKKILFNKLLFFIFKIKYFYKICRKLAKSGFVFLVIIRFSSKIIFLLEILLK